MTISIQLEDDGFCLYVTSYGRTNPAGPRLFRAPPHPDIRFTHDTLAEAERAQEVLQAYLDEAAKRKRPSKAQARKMGAD